MIGSLFAGLFDDAALFPPGNATMPAAVRCHAEHQQSSYAELVGAFVCPAGRLAELDQALATAGLGSPEVSMTVPGGCAGLAEALAAANRQPRLAIRSVELPVAAGELPAAVTELAPLARSGVRVFAEIAVAELSLDVAAVLHQAGIGLKLRTGGSTTAAFPEPAALAGAIETAVTAGVSFKCTAGLHNAVAHRDPATGFCHHGFLNVLLAVHAAQCGSGDAGELLASRDGTELAERAGALRPAEVSPLRAQFRSIGSCSISEPLADLQALALVGAA